MSKNEVDFGTHFQKPLGPLLGPTWASLGPLLGGSGASLGRLLASLGLSWRLLGTLWELPGCNFGIEKPSQEHIATLLFTKMAQDTSREPPGTLPGVFLVPFWDPPGIMLSYFWGMNLAIHVPRDPKPNGHVSDRSPHAKQSQNNYIS